MHWPTGENVERIGEWKLDSFGRQRRRNDSKESQQMFVNTERRAMRRIERPESAWQSLSKSTESTNRFIESRLVVFQLLW